MIYNCIISVEFYKQGHTLPSYNDRDNYNLVHKNTC